MEATDPELRGLIEELLSDIDGVKQHAIFEHEKGALPAAVGHDFAERQADPDREGVHKSSRPFSCRRP
jgi:hypothetical protein